MSLGVLARKKTLIEHLNAFKITSSYQEVRQFKISAAVNAESSVVPNLNAKLGLIQIISDNFDANISSQNGRKETHGLATIICQNPSDARETTERVPIPRLPFNQLKDVQLKNVNLKFYKGVKDPPMPQEFALCGVLPLKLLCQQVLSVKSSFIKDFEFIKSILTADNVADYHGFNTKLTRESGECLKEKTNIFYTPLIDNKPSDPSTILTAMLEYKNVTEEAGQAITIFTADQQLYRVALDIIWSNPEKWSTFFVRLSGKHMLMSFIGCVGMLMTNSGLTALLKSAFSGVEKMLTGKKFPMNLRALRIVFLELLRGYIDEIHSYDELVRFIDMLSAQSVLAEHWVNNLIKPVLIMMLYVRAEREADFSLHLYACKEMIPYFFAAGHVNYARYSICYMRSM